MTHTIEMLEDQWNLWLAAMRNPAYTQFDGGSMVNPNDPNCMCVLGILQRALAGEVEHRNTPSPEFLESHGIQFYHTYGQSPFDDTVPYVAFIGVNNMMYFHKPISVLNDMGLTFEQLISIMTPLVKFITIKSDEPLMLTHE